MKIKPQLDYIIFYPKTLQNQFNKRYFHLVLETDKMTPEEEVKLVLSKLGLP